MKDDTEIYIITATKKKDGSTVYYDVDNASGGYPYWSAKYPGKTFSKGYPDLSNIKSTFYGILEQVSSIRVCKLLSVEVEAVNFEKELKEIISARNAAEAKRIKGEIECLNERLRQLGEI